MQHSSLESRRLRLVLQVLVSAGQQEVHPWRLVGLLEYQESHQVDHLRGPPVQQAAKAVSAIVLPLLE